MEKIGVLIADDQTLMRDGLKTILELEENMKVVGVAKDGVEALELFKQTMPQVVLMDIRMPKMDGVECTKLIKEFCPDAIVLILTTFDDEEYIIEALNGGAAGYMLKDIEGDNLIKAIVDAYNGNFILPSKIAIKLAARLSKNSSLENEAADKAKENKLLSSLNLSEKELELAKMLSEGFTNKQIASAMYISEGTVKNYVSNIYSKIGISDRTVAAIYFKKLLEE